MLKFEKFRGLFFRDIFIKHEICMKYEKCLVSVLYFMVCFAKTLAKYPRRFMSFHLEPFHMYGFFKWYRTCTMVFGTIHVVCGQIEDGTAYF